MTLSWSSRCNVTEVRNLSAIDGPDRDNGFLIARERSVTKCLYLLPWTQHTRDEEWFNVCDVVESCKRAIMINAVELVARAHPCQLN